MSKINNIIQRHIDTIDCRYRWMLPSNLRTHIRFGFNPSSQINLNTSNTIYILIRERITKDE